MPRTNKPLNIIYYGIYLPFVLAVLVTGIYLVVRVNVHGLSWLLATVTNLLLAGFVFTSNPVNPRNRYFALLTFTASFWTIDIFGFYIIQSLDAVTFWSAALRPAYLFLPPILFQLMLSFANPGVLSRRDKTWLYIAYAISTTFLILHMFGRLESEMTRHQWAYFPRIGFLYFLTIINAAFWTIVGLWYVAGAYLRAESVRTRKQLKYIFIAHGMVVMVAVITNLLFGLGYRVYPVGGISLIIYAGLLAYAIVRYQLLDIEVYVKKSIVYAGLTIFVIILYAIVVAILAGIFGFQSAAVPGGIWLANALTGLIIALVFLPVRNWLQSSVDVLFFREKYDYRQTLKRFSGEMTMLFEIDVLVRKLLVTVSGTMHIRFADLLLYNPEKNNFVSACAVSDGMLLADNTVVAGDAPLIEWFKAHKTYLTFQGIEPADTDMIRLHDRMVQIVIPLFVKEKLIGIFNLAEKKSEEPYSNADIELLLTLVNQAAIAIETARLTGEVRALEKNLLQSDKLSALGTLAASVAHEIKNPLSAIKTFCQLLNRRMGDPVFVEKFNEVVPGEIERVEGVLRQLLDFGRFSEIKFTAVNVGKTINDLLVLLHYEIFKQKVQVSIECGDNVPPIKASDEQIKQVFMNLILNAVQAMPNGGSLRISAVLLAEKNEVRVAFTDTGCGISAENIDKLFAPFFTTKEFGTGLGLSITDKIVREHGGRVKVSSVVGTGTTFEVFLPVAGHV